MKKQISMFLTAMMTVGIVPVMAAVNTGTRAASSVNLTDAPYTREKANVDYKKYETRTTASTYAANDAKNLYYTQPVKRSDLYKQYQSNQTSASTQTVRTSRSEVLSTQMRRKYFLAHPFFQPLQGEFGSVTDLSYNTNSYDLTLTPVGATSTTDNNGTWNGSQISVKEDLSYGITDRIAVMGMLRYDIADYELDWAASPDDKMSNSDLSLFGLGAQWRFVDNDKWIATASAYFQHQKDIANNFILDLKAGYKISTTTIYGLGRAWYVDFDGSIYGNGINGVDANGNGSGIFIAYETNADSAVYAEGGFGIFSVLDEDWTLNLEAVLGYYDWHNQANLKAAFGWQPNDWFALNLYAKTAVYDSADGQDLDFLFWGVDNPTWTNGGSVNIENYSETSIGLQAMFKF